MSATDTLYRALLAINVPAEKAREMVNALEAARGKTDVRDAIARTPAFTNLSEPELEALRDELLELMIRHARQ